MVEAHVCEKCDDKGYTGFSDHCYPDWCSCEKGEREKRNVNRDACSEYADERDWMEDY